MNKYICRLWASGDWFRPPSNKNKPVRVNHKGFGDMIGEYNSAYSRGPGTIITDYINPALDEFLDVVDNIAITYKQDKELLEEIAKYSWDNKSAEEYASKIFDEPVHCVTPVVTKSDGEYYLKVVPKSIPLDRPENYITVAFDSNVRRSRISKTMINNITKNKNVIDVGRTHWAHNEKDTIKILAYLIYHSDHFIGLDSGMSHFALMLKNDEDITIYTNKNKRTGVIQEWINSNINVIEI